MKRVQHGKRCNMKRVQKSAPQKSSRSKGYNMEKMQHETTRKKYKKIATVHHEKTFNMKGMQYGKRCNMKRVQD